MTAPKARSPMTDDIVARLRVLASEFPTLDGIMDSEWTNAANEIERLRLEMSIPRDEYAMTWKNLLDRIDGLDIVEWIRAYANAYSPSDYSSPIAREVVVRSDKRWLEAADEIERLRAERNQLRAEIVDRVLRFRADVPWNTDSKARMKCEAYAAERGWFGLYDEINKLASKIEAADA